MNAKNTMKKFSGILVLGLLAAPACYDGGPEGELDDVALEENVGSVDQAMTASLCDDISNATIIGTAGNDSLLGTSGPDVIFGLGGDDFIDGKGGNDVICGGDGNDNLKGGDGDDEIHGGAGYNFIFGNAGDDTIHGGDNGNDIQGNDGDDEILGGASADTIYGGNGHDLVRGGDGDDYIDGYPGDDALFGDGGNDQIIGNAGNDCIDGGAGDDQVDGGDGDDCVSGNDGVDQVVCGAGNDTYSDGEWDFAGCETAGTCDCEPECNNLKEDFSDNLAGWTLGPEWEIAPAQVSSGANGLCSQSADPATDHTPDTTDNGVAGVHVGGNTTTPQHGYYYLTSPVIDTTGEPDLFLEYYRWLVSDYTPFMANHVQVFDGTSWQTIYQTGPYPPVIDTSWVQQVFDISAYSNSALQVRFGFNIDSGGVWTCPSWSVDDVRIYSSDCTE